MVYQDSLKVVMRVGAVLLVLASCSSIDRKMLARQSALPDPQNESRMSAPEEEDFAELIRALPQSPRTLAVHLNDTYAGVWNWTAADRGEIVGWRTALKNPNLFDSMYVMSGVFSTGNSLTEFRYAAAQHGANTVLVMFAGGDAAKGINPLALLYLTLIGYYIFPGSSASAVMAVNGVVLDVATGAELARLSVQATGYTIAPGGWLDTHDAIGRAKRDGLKQLKRQFLSQLDELPVPDAPEMPAAEQPRRSRRPQPVPRVLSY